MRIEDVFFELGMAGDMNLGHALRIDAVEVIKRIEAVVLRRHVNIVHIQQDAAVGLLDHLVQELPFSHLGNVIFGVAAYVFNGHRNFQEITHVADVFSRLAGSLKGIRHRKQVVGISAIHAAPA